MMMPGDMMSSISTSTRYVWVTYVNHNKCLAVEQIPRIISPILIQNSISCTTPTVSWICKILFNAAAGSFFCMRSEVLAHAMKRWRKSHWMNLQGFCVHFVTSVLKWEVLAQCNRYRLMMIHLTHSVFQLDDPEESTPRAVIYVYEIQVGQHNACEKPQPLYD